MTENQHDKIGPYYLAPLRQGLSMEEIYAMPPKHREVFLGNMQTMRLQPAALAESQNDDMSNLGLLKLNGESVTFEEIVEMGRSLPDEYKLELVKQVMNQNITYTPPELDPFIPRRQSAPDKSAGDYAQTIRETLTSGIGDCEDWAIAEADLLVRMGISPQNIKIMSGTVYNTHDNTEFDHSNLAVKTSDGSWSVIEIGKDKSFIISQDYLDEGIEGYYFVPNIAIGADSKIENFKLDNTEQPKYGFTSSCLQYETDEVDHADSNITGKFSCAADGNILSLNGMEADTEMSQQKKPSQPSKMVYPDP